MVKKEERKEEVSKEESKLKPAKKNYYSNILQITLIVAFFILILVFSLYFSVKASSNYNYNGIDFKTVQEGELILYQTAIPVMHKGSLTPYNFYLRTSPKELEKVDADFENFELMDLTAWNFEGDISCEGYGVIAMENLRILHNVTEMTFIRDDNATCDSQGRYNFIHIKEGSSNKITETGNNCYEITFKDCEILKPTERYFLEVLTKLKEINLI
ncbi:MAG: hypothetical protein KC516_03890 [Nanoarchaeota archaeon]|nr:hypothetical protein [Nanoarchaeota archaeon]